MRAVVVFPTPRTPVRIQACGMRPLSNAFETVRTMASCPIRSSKLAGRYLRASTRYPSAGASAGAEPETADFLGSLIVPSASPPRRARTDREQVKEMVGG